jgi:hypothetical protein
LSSAGGKPGGAGERRAALAAIVELARAHGLGAAEVAAALEPPQPDGAGPDGARPAALTRLLAYLGGLFVFSGLAIFIGTQWALLNSPARIIATLGSGLAVFAAAFAALSKSRLAAAVTPLFLIAAVLQPAGILVAIDEYSRGGDWRYAVLATSGVMLAQQLVSFLAVGRTVLLFASLFFGAVFSGTAMDLIGLGHDLNALVVGASLLSLARSLERTPHAAIGPFWQFVGAGTLLGGFFGLVVDTAVEPLFLGAACGMVYLSTHWKSRSLLVVSTLAILGYIGYFTERNFLDAVGWPLALVAFGLAMIALSAVAVRINRRYIVPAR